MHGLVNKGMGEIFHDQTKGFKFVCDSLHDSQYTSISSMFSITLFNISHSVQCFKL